MLKHITQGKPDGKKGVWMTKYITAKKNGKMDGKDNTIYHFRSAFGRIR